MKENKDKRTTQVGENREHMNVMVRACTLLSTEINVLIVKTLMGQNVHLHRCISLISTVIEIPTSSAYSIRYQVVDAQFRRGTSQSKLLVLHPIALIEAWMCCQAAF